MYTIGRLARRANVNSDSIRFYERQGLLSPATKTDAGYRLYADDAVRRIAFIKHAQRCGFSLAEIRELVKMHTGDSAAREEGYRLAAEKQTEIQDTIEALHAMNEALEGLLQTRNDDSARAPMQFEESALAIAREGSSGGQGSDNARPGGSSRSHYATA